MLWSIFFSPLVSVLTLPSATFAFLWPARDPHWDLIRFLAATKSILSPLKFFILWLFDGDLSRLPLLNTCTSVSLSSSELIMSSSDSSIVRSAGEGGTEEGGLLIGRDKLVKLDEEPLSDMGREACKEERRARPPEDAGLEMDMHTESREGHSSSLFDCGSICCNMHMSGS